MSAAALARGLDKRFDFATRRPIVEGLIPRRARAL